MPVCTWVRTDCSSHVTPYYLAPNLSIYLRFILILSTYLCQTNASRAGSAPPPPSPLFNECRGCYTMWLGKLFLTFQQIILPSSSGSSSLLRLEFPAKPLWQPQISHLIFEDSCCLKVSDVSWTFLTQNVFCSIPKTSDRLLPIPPYIVCLYVYCKLLKCLCRHKCLNYLLLTNSTPKFNVITDNKPFLH